VSVLLLDGVVGAGTEPVALVPDDRDAQALTLVLEGGDLLPGGRWTASLTLSASLVSVSPEVGVQRWGVRADV
jgi:hypothetical protein